MTPISNAGVAPREGKPVNGNSEGVVNVGAIQKPDKAMTAATPLPTSFAALKLSPPLIRSLAALSITVPTPIQAQTIPFILSGRDVVGGAQTGSGKTLAFALPILQQLARDPVGGFAVILTPTRELAVQLHEQFVAVGAGAEARMGFALRCALVLGGMDMHAQATLLQRDRPHIIVATPGRLVDHLRSKGDDEWGLSRCRFVVLDEADRLLSTTFAPELAHLFSVLPSSSQRQTLLFTATLTPEIESLVTRPVDSTSGKLAPIVCKIEQSTTTPEQLRQSYLLVPSHVREPYLVHLLLHPPCGRAAKRRHEADVRNKARRHGQARWPKSDTDSDDEDTDDASRCPPTIIFVSRARTASLLTRLLTQLDFRIVSLHSSLSQPARLGNLAAFRARAADVLICTDVGARGLDVPEVRLVINYDVPAAWEDYVHRVGRTARAGRDGWAVSFVTERDADVVGSIEDKIGLKLDTLTLPEEKVLARLNAVSTAKRVATMEMADEGFSEKEEKRKSVSRDSGNKARKAQAVAAVAGEKAKRKRQEGTV